MEQTGTSDKLISEISEHSPPLRKQRDSHAVPAATWFHRCHQTRQVTQWLQYQCNSSTVFSRHAFNARGTPLTTYCTVTLGDVSGQVEDVWTVCMSEWVGSNGSNLINDKIDWHFMMLPGALMQKHKLNGINGTLSSGVGATNVCTKYAGAAA